MGVKRDLILVVTMSFVALMTPTVALADTIDRTDRAAVRTAYEQSYQSIVDRLTFPESPWTGSVTECDAATVPSSVRDGLMAGVNFFRALAGVDAGTRDPAADTKAQAAALVMHANEELSHEPPPTWACWSNEASEGASHSNLHLFRLTGSGFLHEALEAFMDDPGPSNTAVGHRQLILSPSGGPFAFGATSNAMALWVVGPYPTDGHDGAPEYVAWPPDGYFPIELATARWSLSHTSFLTADLSSASVSMTFEEEPVDIIVHHSPGNYGRMPTVTWDVTDHRFDDWLSRGRDISFDVTVTGIEVDGVSTSRSYTVTMVGAAEHAEPPDHDWFVDDNGSIFQPDIEWLATQGSPTAATGPAPDTAPTTPSPADRWPPSSGGASSRPIGPQGRSEAGQASVRQRPAMSPNERGTRSTAAPASRGVGPQDNACPTTAPVPRGADATKHERQHAHRATGLIVR